MMVRREMFPFEDQPQIRAWAKRCLRENCADIVWLPIERGNFDFITMKENRAGEEVRLMIKIALVRERRTNGELYDPKMRKRLLDNIDGGLMPQKTGIIAALKDTHRLFAIRVRRAMFLDGFRSNEVVARGDAIELAREDASSLDTGLSFIAMDDGERIK